MGEYRCSPLFHKSQKVTFAGISWIVNERQLNRFLNRVPSHGTKSGATGVSDKIVVFCESSEILSCVTGASFHDMNTCFNGIPIFAIKSTCSCVRVAAIIFLRAKYA